MPDMLSAFLLPRKRRAGLRGRWEDVEEEHENLVLQRGGSEARYRRPDAIPRGEDPGNSPICSALLTPDSGLKKANFWLSGRHV